MKKKIVILGAGFGGISAALRLEKRIRRAGLFAEYEIVLVDRNDYHLYTPALYEIAAIPSGEADAMTLKRIICMPIEEIINGRRITFVQDRITALDPSRRRILLADGEDLVYEYAVVALGSETSYFNIPGMQKHAHALKNFEDAVRIRNVIEKLLREDRSATIIVVGGGATGVEVTAEFSNFVCMLQKKIVGRKKGLCEIRIILLEASPEILPGFDNWIVTRAKQHLALCGVEVKTNATVAEAAPAELHLKDSTRLPYDLLVWTGGAKGAAVLETFNLPLTKKGTLAVNEYLESTTGVYAIGDAAGFVDARTQKPIVWNVPAAEDEAHYIADVLICDILQKKKTPFRPSRQYPYVLTVGRKYAIADLVWIRFAGLTGWVMKLFVELYYLLLILPIRKALRIWGKSVILYTSND